MPASNRMVGIYSAYLSLLLPIAAFPNATISLNKHPWAISLSGSSKRGAGVFSRVVISLSKICPPHTSSSIYLPFSSLRPLLLLFLPSSLLSTPSPSPPSFSSLCPLLPPSPLFALSSLLLLYLPSPPSPFQWYLNGTLLHTGGTYMVSMASSSDSGEYTCEARNTRDTATRTHNVTVETTG